MNSSFAPMLLILFMMVCFMLAGSSRLQHCIRLIAVQGLLIGCVPLLTWDWTHGAPHGEILLVSVINVAVKFILLPWMMFRTAKKAGISRELDPLIGYSWSLLAVIAFGAAAFFITGKMELDTTQKLLIPAALTSMLTGLFIIVARRKAITQVLGFLAFENGISLFGAVMHLEYGFLIELGILLDVWVLVFLMGIAVFQISCAFEHIDTDRMMLLKDTEDK